MRQALNMKEGRSMEAARGSEELKMVAETLRAEDHGH